MRTTHAMKIQEATQVGAARRMAVDLATKLGLESAMAHRAALVVTEMGTNLVRHTLNQGGEILLQPLTTSPAAKVIEILSLDRGPGIDNVALALQDGFTTSSTPGGGLGGMKRASTDFEIYSRPGTGTASWGQGTMRTGSASTGCSSPTRSR